MSIDTRYTAKEALAWETYDDDYIAFTKKEKGHPGPVPPGYVEAYMTRHPKAPHPSKYPALEAEWANRHATAQPCTTPTLKIAKLQCSASTELATSKSYGVRAKFNQPKARLVPASGWKRRQVNKAAEKGKGKGRKGKSKWGRARVAAVKTETAEAGPSEAAREMTPSPEEMEDGSVAPEDVFMADYTKFKDEDDDAAPESLFSDDDATVSNAFDDRKGGSSEGECKDHTRVSAWFRQLRLIVLVMGWKRTTSPKTRLIGRRDHDTLAVKFLVVQPSDRSHRLLGGLERYEGAATFRGCDYCRSQMVVRGVFLCEDRSVGKGYGNSGKSLLKVEQELNVA
ncbi:hypothetical protein FB451DRAFT_1372245 [Mycena latifolia]|nr:hypothetical protein FB451DRAFT_1372245 [Mycena latifolia]